MNYFILILIVIRWGPHEPHFMDGKAEAQAICRPDRKEVVEPATADSH